MPEVKITGDTLLYVVAALVVVAGVVTALVKGWEAWKKISVRDRVAALEGQMKEVNRRLDISAKRFKHQSDDMGQMLITMQGLLSHMISGNDRDKLRSINEGLQHYMAQRTTRETEDEE